MKRLSRTLGVLLVIVSCCAHAEQGVVQEVWTRIKGSKVTNLTTNGAYKRTAKQARIIKTFDVEALGDEYGARYSALLKPRTTGDYTFWIASDDAGELWLSTDNKPAGLKKIAVVKSYSGIHSWSGGKQQSKAIHLEKGKSYLIRVLHKEGGGVDHMSVAWQGPGIKKGLIKADFLQTPEVDRKTATLIKKTQAMETKLGVLRKQLAACTPQGLQSFVNKLSSGDRKLLAQELFSFCGKASRKPHEYKDQLKRFAKLAGALMPSEAKPITDAVYKALLLLEETYLKSLSLKELAKLGPHRCASSLGGIPSTAKPADRLVKLTSKATKQGDELVSTGLYALPGKPVTLTVPARCADKKLALQIGHHLRAKEKNAFDAMPDTTRVFPIEGNSITAINPHGGLIFVKVPAKVGLNSDEFSFKGVIDSPRFILGKTTDAAWRTIRNNPGPWGELIAENFIIVAQREALKTIDNPTALMTWWRDNVRRHEGFYNYSIGKPLRMHACHYAVMGFSTWPLYENKETVYNIINLKQMMHYNDGLFLHEHGHHGDDSRMFFGKIGESTPNWAGYYLKGTGKDFAWKDTEETHMFRLFDPKDSLHREIMQNKWWTEKWTHHWSYPMTSIVIGYVQGFGWEAFKTCVHRFTHPEDPINKLAVFTNNPAVRKKSYSRTPADHAILDQIVMDKWLIFLSQEAKHDIRPYLRRFYIRPSVPAATVIDKMNLPKWDLMYCPKRPVVVQSGRSVKLALPSDYALSFDVKPKFAWTSAAAHGKLDGSIYTPKPGFTGKDVIPFTLADKYGNIQKKELEIYVVDAKSNPHITSGAVTSLAPGKWHKVMLANGYRNPVFIASPVMPPVNKRDRNRPVFTVRVRNLTPTGCEISLHQVEGTPDPAAKTINWIAMEAGSYTNGRLAEAGIATVAPERLSYKMVGLLKGFEGNIPKIRSSRFGQVLTSNDPKPTEFYWEDVRPTCSIRFGCHTGLTAPTSKTETIGYIMFQPGLYQFANTSVRVTQSAITVGAVTVKADRANLKNLIRSKRRELGAMQAKK